MNTLFTYPKIKYNKKDVRYMYMFFDNGDYLIVKGMEIVDISINVYDKLIWHGQGVSPVAESGFIKLKVINKNSCSFSRGFLYNSGEYRKGRKQYIERRCCEEYVKEVWLFDENNSLTDRISGIMIRLSSVCNVSRPGLNNRPDFIRAK